MLSRISSAAVASFFLAIGAAAATDFNAVIKTEDGKPFCLADLKLGEDCPADKVLTLGVASRNALYASFPDEQNLTGDERYKRGELASKLKGEVDLKVEDVALIKRLIGKMYAPVLVYPVWNMLDPPKK